jgi:hypothetical protein
MQAYHEALGRTRSGFTAVDMYAAKIHEPGAPIREPIARAAAAE